MQNNLYQTTPEFKTGLKTDQQKIGGLAKSQRIQRTQLQREAIEQQFMQISFKANRADNQREERRNKRK